MTMSRRGCVCAALYLAACALGYADFRVIKNARDGVISAPFGMTTESMNNGVLLKWNAAEPRLAAAEGADLFIDDGAYHTRLVLLRDQLAPGLLVYAPFTKDVRFRLVAHTPDGRSAAESIRMIGNDSVDVADRAIPGRRAAAQASGTVTMRVVSNEVNR